MKLTLICLVGLVLVLDSCTAQRGGGGGRGGRGGRGGGRRGQFSFRARTSDGEDNRALARETLEALRGCGKPDRKSCVRDTCATTCIAVPGCTEGIEYCPVSSPDLQAGILGKKTSSFKIAGFFSKFSKFSNFKIF